MFIPSDKNKISPPSDKKKFENCKFEKNNQVLMKMPKNFEPAIIKRINKTLGTSIISSQITPLSVSFYYTFPSLKLTHNLMFYNGNMALTKSGCSLLTC